MKFIKYAVLTVTVLFIGIATYDYFKLGYHTLPNNTPENSFPLRFENGIRAILGLYLFYTCHINYYPESFTFFTF